MCWLILQTITSRTTFFLHAPLSLLFLLVALGQHGLWIRRGKTFFVSMDRSWSQRGDQTFLFQQLSVLTFLESTANSRDHIKDIPPESLWQFQTPTSNGCKIVSYGHFNNQSLLKGIQMHLTIQQRCYHSLNPTQITWTAQMKIEEGCQIVTRWGKTWSWPSSSPSSNLGDAFENAAFKPEFKILSSSKPGGRVSAVHFFVK